MEANGRRCGGTIALGVVLVVELACVAPPRSAVRALDGPPDAPARDAAPTPDLAADVAADVAHDAAPLSALRVDTRVPLVPPWSLRRTGGAYPEVTSDGAWCWFAEPRALRHQGLFDRTYLGWITSAGEVSIGSVDHQTGTKVIALIKTLGPDDHDSPTLLVLPSGRIAAFYCHHCGNKLYYRITKAPEDVSSWGPEYTVPGNTPGGQGYTYPNPISLAEEGHRIYLFWRGGGWQPTVSTSETGVNWSPPKVLIETGQSRPYVKYASDNKARIHFAFTDGHPFSVAANSIYHAYYEKGAFYRTDGTLIGSFDELPLTPAMVGAVYDAASGDGRSWLWDIGLDPSGAPIITYATFPEQDDHRYYYARWTGSAWKTDFLTTAGTTLANAAEPYYSGGIVLDAEDSNTVYLSKMTATVYEIERWSYKPSAAAWFSTPVTSDSLWENVRPVSVRNHGYGPMQLLWMHGDYEYYHLQYDTSLKFFPGE